MKTRAVRLYGKNDLRLEEFDLPAIPTPTDLGKNVFCSNPKCITKLEPTLPSQFGGEKGAKFCKYCDFEATTNCVENIGREEFMKLNGRLCVWSECGYIPDFVRKELENICVLHCNHMG